MDKKDRVRAIIASGKTCFVEANAAALEGLDEASLKALENHVVEVSKVASEPAKVEEPKVEEPKVKTPEELDAEFYARNPGVAAMLSEHKAASAARHASLVATLKAAQKAYSEDELKAKPVAELEKLAALAESLSPKKDFTGAGAPRIASSADDKTPPAPIDIAAYIKAQKTA